MKLNLDRNYIDLRGNPKDEKLCEALADILATSSTVRPAQTIAWAYNLISYGEIEINKDDALFIIELVKANRIFIDLVKDQIIKEIEKAMN